MSVKIERHITKYRVDKPEAEAPKAVERKADPGEFRKDGARVIHLHEKLERPEVLIGSTYKIKTPVSEYAMYVTINDIVLNQDTEHEQRQPFEVFINSKNLDQYQWIVALTRVISAVFRKGGDISFLVDELKSVFDPKGGYWQPGGKFMPSIIAELGHVIEKHLRTTGVVLRPQMDPSIAAEINKKRQELEARAKQADAPTDRARIEGARLCPKCFNVSVVVLDGCSTCLDCGDSKCG
jgi:hypothetical protein